MSTNETFSVARRNVATVGRFKASCENLRRPFSSVLCEALEEWLARHEAEALEIARRRMEGPE